MNAETAHNRDDQEQARSSTGRVQSLDRAMALLNAVSAAGPQGLPAAELATRCHLNRATAWRLLATLEHHAMVDRDPLTNRYSVGHAVTRIAAAAGVSGLVRRSHDVLERLSRTTGETANLAVAQRLGLTYVDEVAPPLVLSARWLGRQTSMHATSAGKAFLAWLPAEEIESILASPLPEYTGTTRTDESTLRGELAGIREQGYSVSVGELEAHVYGVAAPVFDVTGRPFAIVSVWGPKERLPESRFAELGELVQKAASEIADALP
jgi:DNA-binding IclR family transcriptional regulator